MPVTDITTDAENLTMTVTADFAVLAVFTVGALAITALAAYRSQRVTITRLHPTLVV